ncbi:hypothetical protein SAMN02799630_00912 [Paenibacillus sp. UNCCL117]|uniref:hypothetical protein n=1 Tax=unclassified Paenibacillus TaxID=185978 RepID=UPI00088C07F1|nr:MULTISPECIES: hypothetical protein [unclassified Paenibacillus]SDC25037.1 hypothetical protein SAMN04488602_101713 [Paenibacillus sp. cl123]SFW19737.1 hypothetical protein SAMN02799630_00912 [Paenibacillus sp. UNCCL117]
MPDKKTYYITVGSGEILEPAAVTGNFEFEIEASQEDIDKLQELFEDKEDEEQDTAIAGLTPYRQLSDDEENDAYDWTLTEIYMLLHRLGTPETRRQIEAMRVLPT